MGIELYPHNLEAYRAVRRMMAEKGLAAVVHPTGTGKSFIAFKLCEDEPDKTICWLSPSEYIFKTQIENLKATGAAVPQNIRFCTYARLKCMDRAEMAELRPDILVLDEFHRVGAAVWGDAVRKFLSLYPGAPMLGLSATAVRYLDGQRDMADELFGGNVASEMTLGEAIVRGILAAPKYVMAAFVYQNELERLGRRIYKTRNMAVRSAAERYYEALRRALEKADGLDVIFDRHMTNRTGKYIVFTANIHAMRECMGRVGEWFGRVDAQPHVYSLYSLDPATLQSFADFKADDDTSHLRLLFCIDALNEGIHVADVDGVILFRPTISPIVYKQQIGRALSAGKTDAPVIFDIVNNFEGLYSIGSLEEEMRAAITYYNYFGDGEQIVTERFRLVDEVRDCRELFERLEETLTASWDAMYGLAKTYHAQFGNLDVPTKYKTPGGYSLGAWVQTQRLVRAGKAEGVLGKDRIAKLDALGMRWESVNDVSWGRHYAACRAYRAGHGDLNVPTDHVTEDGVRLGAWIKSVRAYRRSGIRSNYFTPEREKLLDELGMVWSQPDHLWDRNYAVAKAYHAEHGDLEVPHGYIQDGVKLCNWLADLRKIYRNAPGRRGTLTAAQIAQMDALGMRWKSKNDLAWEKGYAYAKAYHREHGAVDAPLSYVTPEGFKLGVWLSKCREKYAKGTLSAERVEQLDAIGMVWDKSRKNDWDRCFALAERYYRQHGDLAVPGDYVADGVWLNKWLNEQRQILLGKRAGKSLTQAQRQKLASISFTAEGSGEVRWQQRYDDLLRYYSLHGNSRLPVGYMDSRGQDLYVWLANQRAYAKTGRLSSQRQKLLREVGALSAG